MLQCQPSIRDYQLKSIIGTGGTATVVLAENVNSKKQYALKMINKGRLKTSSIKRLLIERDILSAYKHPFIQKMKECFQDACHVYFVTPFAKRGDLFSCIKDGPLPKKGSMFYLCEIACAIRFLHENNIIHGDIKLENVLVNDDGHIILTDFGVSEMNKGETFGLSGTISYFAPEMFTSNKKSFVSDMWAVGVLLYELVEAKIPWQGFNRSQMTTAIINSNLPESLTFKDEDIELFIRRLCTHEHELRITSTELCELIVERGFVQSWDDVEQKKMVPPSKPATLEELRTTIPEFEVSRESTHDILIHDLLDHSQEHDDTFGEDVRRIL